MFDDPFTDPEFDDIPDDEKFALSKVAEVCLALAGGDSDLALQIWDDQFDNKAFTVHVSYDEIEGTETTSITFVDAPDDGAIVTIANGGNNV